MLFEGGAEHQPNKNRKHGLSYATNDRKTEVQKHKRTLALNIQKSVSDIYRLVRLVHIHEDAGEELKAYDFAENNSF